MKTTRGTQEHTFLVKNFLSFRHLICCCIAARALYTTMYVTVNDNPSSLNFFQMPKDKAWLTKTRSNVQLSAMLPHYVLQIGEGECRLVPPPGQYQPVPHAAAVLAPHHDEGGDIVTCGSVRGRATGSARTFYSRRRSSSRRRSASCRGHRRSA